MINEYTMKQIEFGFTSEYKGGSNYTFQSVITNIKNKVSKAKAMPSSLSNVQNLEDLKKNAKKIRAFLDILDDMQRVDIVGLATANAKLYLNEAEKVKATEVLVQLDSIRFNINALLFNKTLGSQVFGAFFEDRRELWQSIWPKVNLKFGDIRHRPIWFTVKVAEGDFWGMINAAHQSLTLSYKPVEEKLYSWVKGFPIKGKFYKPVKYDENRKNFIQEIKDFNTNFPVRIVRR